MKVEAHKQLREQKIAETEKLKEEKVTQLEAFKANIPPEEIEAFNEEEWLIQWGNDHPFPDIPENVQFDIDEDLDEP